MPISSDETLLLLCEHFDTLPEEFLGQVEVGFIITLKRGCSFLLLSVENRSGSSADWVWWVMGEGRLWLMRVTSALVASRSLYKHSREKISYPSRTFWYLPGSRCWNSIRFTSRVDISWSPNLNYKMMLLNFPR